MIRGFRHRGLKRFFERDRSLIRSDLEARVEVMLAHSMLPAPPRRCAFPTTGCMH